MLFTLHYSRFPSAGASLQLVPLQLLTTYQPSAGASLQLVPLQLLTTYQYESTVKILITNFLRHNKLRLYACAG